MLNMLILGFAFVM